MKNINDSQDNTDPSSGTCRPAVDTPKITLQLYFYKLSMISMAGGFFGFTIGKREDYDSAISIFLRSVAVYGGLSAAVAFYKIFCEDMPKLKKLWSNFIQFRRRNPNLKQWKDGIKNIALDIWYVPYSTLKETVPKFFWLLGIPFILSVAWVLYQKYSLAAGFFGAMEAIGMFSLGAFSCTWIIDQLGDDIRSALPKEHPIFGFKPIILVAFGFIAFVVPMIYAKGLGELSAKNSAHCLKDGEPKVKAEQRCK